MKKAKQNWGDGGEKGEGGGLMQIEGGRKGERDGEK